MLFDLLKDPGEKNNLAGTHPQVAQKLTKLVTNWNKTMPADNGPQLGRK